MMHYKCENKEVNVRGVKMVDCKYCYSRTITSSDGDNICINCSNNLKVCSHCGKTIQDGDAETKKIMTRLHENYKEVEHMGYEVLGVFLQGSQNYGLAYEGSDIDCKAIILPSIDDIILNNKPISTTYVQENNEHIDLKDIRLMFECFKKQNVNFVEILFTDYMVLNPKYEALFAPMFENKEKIAHYNNFVSVNCMYGMALEKYKAMEHPYPATLTKIEKFGYDGKQLHHMIRLKEFMERYIDGVSYKDCLKSTNREHLIEVKANRAYNLAEAREVGEKIKEEITAMKNDFMEKNTPIVDREVDEIMKKVLLDVIKLSLEK